MIAATVPTEAASSARVVRERSAPRVTALPLRRPTGLRARPAPNAVTARRAPTVRKAIARVATARPTGARAVPTVNSAPAVSVPTAAAPTGRIARTARATKAPPAAIADCGGLAANDQ